MAEPQAENHGFPALRATAAVVLVIVLAISAYLLVNEIRAYQAVRPLASPRQMRGFFQRSGAPSVNAIADWMTFDYVSRVFGVDATALKAELAITDARYPRLSIRQWASGAHLTSAQALARVSEAVRTLKPAAY